MMGVFRDRFLKLGKVANGLGFATGVLDRTGLLAALSPRGVAAFARRARGIRPGPHAAVMLHAANKPEKIALVQGTRRVRYDELDHRTNQLSHALIELGVGPGDRVAMMLPNSIEYLVAQQAMARIGATAVQIGYRLKGPEIAYILENSAPQAVIVHREYLSQMDDARRSAGLLGDDAVIVTGAGEGAQLRGQRWEQVLAAQDGTNPPRVGSRGGGVIIYTSGTTGKPKGANRDFRQVGLEAVADFMATMGMRHDDVHLVICPLYHSAAPAFAGMMMTLGATVVVCDHFDPEQILATIQRERVTSAFMVPTMLVRLTALDESVRRRYDTSSLRWICSGAAPLATDTARRFQEQFGYILWNFYGATETGMVTLAGPDDHAAHPGTVGRPLRGNEVRLLDEHGSDVAPGDVGEIYVRNSMLITGYHKNDEATDDARREGFFSVGDLARIDSDGFYYLESRKHDMVISGGVNIYPREIEDHLHTHPDILEVAVIGVPDSEWGESLKAFVVARQGARLSADDVIGHCREGLADYKCPRSVEFLDALPHNPTGKVLKRELRARESDR